MIVFFCILAAAVIFAGGFVAGVICAVADYRKNGPLPERVKSDD